LQKLSPRPILRCPQNTRATGKPNISRSVG
jgi:hypothetical protein